MLKKYIIFVEANSTRNMTGIAGDTNFATTILPRLCRFIPGLEKAVLFFRSIENDKIAAAYTDRRNRYETAELPNQTKMDHIRAMRKRSQPWEWFDLSQLNFEINSYNPEGQTLMTALSESVLLLRLPTPVATDYDLLFLYFIRGVSTLGNTGEEEVIYKQTKVAMGSLLAGVFNEMYQDEKDRREHHKMLMNLVGNVTKEIEHLQKRLTITETSAQERIFRYCSFLLTRESQEYVRPMRYHESAQHKLMHYSGDLDQLENIIHRAVFFAANLTESPGDPVIIMDFHIQYGQEAELHEDVKLVSIQNLNEAEEYLNKLEKAASIVYVSGSKLTGTSLGNVMHPTVTASAISQWLSRYGNQMTQLLSGYPDKWRLIREYFQPLRKKLEANMQNMRPKGSNDAAGG